MITNNFAYLIATVAMLGLLVIFVPSLKLAVGDALKIGWVNGVPPGLLTKESEPTLLEVKEVIDDFGAAFKEAQVRQEKRMDALETKVNMGRLGGGGGGVFSPDHEEHTKAFDAFMRRGDEDGLRGIEMKALNTQTSPDGGFAVPQVVDQEIEKLLRDASSIRPHATVKTVGSSEFKKLVSNSDSDSGWVGEEEVRPETGSPSFHEITPSMGEIYANPSATQVMLDDAFFNVEEWLVDELTEEFTEKENAAFVNGNGIKKPRGFLTLDIAAQADDIRPVGSLEYIPSGAAGAFAASNPSDTLIDLVHKLRSGYRKDAAWFMNSNTLAEVRKFKDGQGDYIWRPGLESNKPDLLLGYPVVEVEAMPDVAANSLSVAFANLKRGYYILDHVVGTRVLRDPYTKKPYVHFYTTKRVGGGVVNHQTIKLVKFAAT